MGTKSALGSGTLVGLVIANMIGAGVFTTSGFALGDLGSPYYVMLAWVIGGCLALCGALSYGALCRLMPVSGGEYLFLSRTIHPLAGFIAGWISLLAGFTAAIAYAAHTFVSYLVPGSANNALAANTIASVTILFAALFHGVRVRHGALLQNISVLVKLAMIAAFIFYVLFGVPVENWAGIEQIKSETTKALSITAFATTLMWISFSYSGFNAASYVAGEVERAGDVIPAALFRATLITTLIYLFLNAIFVFAPAPELVAYKQDIAAIAANALGGVSLATAVRVLIALALFTSISAMIMIGPRVYAQMAEDGLMPGALRITRDTPDTAIAMQAILAIIVVWIATLRELLSYLGFTLGLSTAATVASLFVAVRRDRETAGNLPGYPWAPAIYVVFTLLFAVIAAGKNPWEMLAAVLTVVSGIISYILLTNSNNGV